MVPQARAGLERLKFEVAQELGIPNYSGYLGDVPSRINGAVGGNMVRRMIALAEQQLAQNQPQ
ncbi:MAG TPA: alpha/beta-type small acid-soluble spore protein [Sphingobacteriaceae bacterium]|nr:alpha/beta-type small acid-soluble spore protein [Sphingobacteriaceae bacterium]